MKIFRFWIVFRKLENHVFSEKSKVLPCLKQIYHRFYRQTSGGNSADFIEKRNENETICGRFHIHQLHNRDKSEQLKARFLAGILENFQSNRITAVILLLIFFLTGCSKQKETCAITGNAKATETETETDQIENQNFVMGEVVMPENDSIAEMYKPDSNAVKYRH